MAWVKLTDDFTENGKILDAGPLASWLWVSAIAWSNRNGTNGKIPFAQVPRLATFEGVGVYTSAYSGDDVDARKLADVLADVGLFEPVEGGWLIHDYAEYQLTTDRLAEMTDAKRRAGRAGGKASAEARASASASAQSKPGPGPEKFSTSVVVDDLETAPQAVDGDEASVPAETWVEYARLKRAASKEPIRNVSSYDAKTIRNAKSEHGATAARWWRDFEVTTNELAAALVDGNAGRYWKPRN